MRSTRMPSRCTVVVQTASWTLLKTQEARQSITYNAVDSKDRSGACLGDVLYVVDRAQLGRRSRSHIMWSTWKDGAVDRPDGVGR
jgi:hypothetical protein